MRRSLTLIWITVAVLAGCCGVAAASPVSQPTGPIICPGSAAGPPPCCELPAQAGRGQAAPPCCEPPTILCVLRLTISSSPDPSMTAQAVTVTGHLIGSLAGSVVTLWQRVPGVRNLVAVATTETDAAGDYRFVRKGRETNTNRDWSVSSGFAGSPVISQRVRARVTLKVLVSPAGARVEVVFSGTVGPAHRGEKVAIQRRIGTGWVLVARVTLQHGSKFSDRVLMASTGPERVRVVLNADNRNIWSSSPSRTPDL